MSNSQGICTSCGRLKQSDSKGSLTQWVLLCKCDNLVPQNSQVNTINICINCGKRIGSGRSGSFTQWIFRTEVCECKKPQAVKRTIRELSNQEYAGSLVDLSDVVQVDVDSKKFPTDRFAPIEILGTTYDSTVYLSIDKILGTRVAVKSVDLRSNDNLVRFQKEVRALAKLTYYGIVKVLDFAENEGAPYMVMEYIDGVTMREFLNANSRLSVEDTVTVIKQLSQTLAYCHSKNILHRDIKPENLLVCAGSEPVEIKLVDFGLACTYDTITSHSDTIAGTPTYMAPDSSKGFIYDIRSEVYSLGCVMFELLTGEPPYKSSNALQLLNMHADAEIPRLSSRLKDNNFDSALENIVCKCLAKVPDDRFQTMDELYKAIDQLCSGTEEANEEREVLTEPISNPNVLNEGKRAEDSTAQKVTELRSQLLTVLPLALLTILVISSIFFSNTDKQNNLKLESRKNIIQKPDYSAHPVILQHKFRKESLDRFQTVGQEVTDAYLKQLTRKPHTEMEKIVLDSRQAINVDNLVNVFKKVNIKHVTFANALCSPKYIRTISNSKTIEIVRLDKPSLKDLEAIPQKMKTVTVVAIHNIKVTAAHIRKLKGMIGLDQLRFHYCELDNGVVAEISKMNVTHLSMTTCSLCLEDLASLQNKQDMQFIRMNACTVVERGKSKPFNNRKVNVDTNLVTTGNVIRAPDSLLKVIASINLNRLSFENYLFTKSSILRLAKIPKLSKIVFRRCVIELHTKFALQKLRPDLQIKENFCITVEMGKS